MSTVVSLQSPVPEPSDARLELWRHFVRLLAGQLDRVHFDAWLGRVRLLGCASDRLDLVAPNAFTRDWIVNHYEGELRQAAQRVDGRERAVVVHDATSMAKKELESLPILRDLEPQPGAPRPHPAAHPAVPGPSGPAILPLDGFDDRAGSQGHANGTAPSVAGQPGSAWLRPNATPPGERGGRTSRAAYNESSLRFFEQHSDFSLNEAFTFEQFVTGSCNDLAYASARAVAEFPGGPYNPLFIHGSSGLGKTHLLQAVCQAVLRGGESRRILYLSCENFVNQFIQAVTNGDLEAFRYKYRKVDMLLIDDIQFLEGKTRTQEEFFHTFNTLYNAKNQIVLSSDRPPSSIATLQERLMSRFRWGMVTKIDTPSFETRVAIVNRKARLKGIDIPLEVAQCLAEHVQSNIRELEGAVTKVIGYAELVGRRIDVGVVMEALQDLLPGRSPLTVQNVLDLLEKEFGVQPKEMQSKKRVKSVLLPRQLGIYLARRHTRMSLEEIGGFFGGRDHSTVLHSIHKIEQLMQSDTAMAELVQRLSRTLERS